MSLILSLIVVHDNVQSKQNMVYTFVYNVNCIYVHDSVQYNHREQHTTGHRPERETT